MDTTNPAQQHALRVLLRGQLDGNHVGIGNYTSDVLRNYPYLMVHWLAAQQLIDLDLAEVNGVCLRLTVDGWEAAQEAEASRPQHAAVWSQP